MEAFGLGKNVLTKVRPHITFSLSFSFPLVVLGLQQMLIIFPCNRGGMFSGNQINKDTVAVLV